MDVLFVQAKLHLAILSASHFGTLNTKILNQNMLKRVLIAMLNENRAVSNENFRICLEKSSGRLHLASWDGVTSKISLVLVHF